jgi:hypothetical protein
MTQMTHVAADRPGPLEGVRVLDLGTVYAAPIAAMLLGDFGADVVKVEHPRGDPARTHGHNKDGHGLWWKVISRNKRTVTLDLGKPQGRELLIAIGSSAQIALFVAPVRVLLSFAIGPFPMALVFNPLEIAGVVLAVLVAHVVTHEGESTWIEGLQLLAVYFVLGLVFFFA